MASCGSEHAGKPASRGRFCKPMASNPPVPQPPPLVDPRHGPHLSLLDLNHLTHHYCPPNSCSSLHLSRLQISLPLPAINCIKPIMPYPAPPNLNYDLIPAPAIFLIGEACSWSHYIRNTFFRAAQAYFSIPTRPLDSCASLCKFHDL